MTIIYITRHSIPDKTKYNEFGNEVEKSKSIDLSIDGIVKAQVFFKSEEFKNIEKVYTSDYVRAIKTGKMLKKDIIIDKRLGERIAGISDLTMTSAEFFNRQIEDKNFKFKNGESALEIQNRMYDAIKDIVRDNQNKKILVVTHGASLTFLLMKFCNICLTDIYNKKRKIIFNNKIIFEDKFDYLETFKLTFNKNKLVNLEIVSKL